ncbi:alpha/beta fold hydrolase [Chondrinema litorale]|uniref:alpha/beta fold hydrolase n=1 Tax=Chondrinema litorale TaxID=2994555 RepID=UPI00254351CF|nr:alpha/beta hydrolase [Chondrinema litorale]UZR97901.1 alpha/beta hydrolase [Chondrinema litorale]
MKNMLAPYPYQVSYLTLSDTIELAYMDEGTGDETLIFIHGLASYNTAWEHVFGNLSKSYRCVAVDLPGYGRSSKGCYPSTMSFYADIIAQTIKKLRLKNVVLVGHSMGGQIAITATLNYPEKVSKLVLLAPAGFETFNEDDRKAITSFYTVESILNASDEQIKTNFKYNFYNMPSYIDKLIQERIAMAEASDFELYCHSVVNGVHGMLDKPVFNRLKEIEKESLVLYGANDFLIPNKLLHPSLTTSSVGRSGADQMQNCQLKFIDECGHFMQLEKPAEVISEIRHFLKN